MQNKTEYADFFEAPFTNFGTYAPVPLFSEEQLKEIVDFKKRSSTGG